MRRALGVALATVAGLLAAAGPAWATKTVCSEHCPFTGIQAAIDASAPGATITIGAGSYRENLTIDKPLSLQGAGSRTVIYPSISKPDECEGSSLCGGNASNIILVGADNVTIAAMRLEGDNPGLTSGKVVNGADIDARNGIITDQVRGYENLTVTKVRVGDVFLRGIYPYEGTFDFTRDTVDNVAGEYASIAMFASHASGVMAENKVSRANDAISANWSKGTQFIGNTVTKSSSGVHTDNNGGSGGSADLIKDNKVKECTTDGYGIWVFAPYRSAAVEGNRVSGCAVGLAVFGGSGGEGPTFSNDKVNGTGATVSSGETVGAYITTDQLGFAYGDVNATISGSSLLHFGTGLHVTQSEPSPGQPEGGQATVTASNDSIAHDGIGAFGGPGTVVDAEGSWWGCPLGPNNGSCDSATGTVAYTPWLTLRP
jgi:nitrous oxidase accessory protein NosD